MTDEPTQISEEPLWAKPPEMVVDEFDGPFGFLLVEYQRLLIGSWTAEPQKPASLQGTASATPRPEPLLQPRRRWTIWRP